MEHRGHHRADIAAVAARHAGTHGIAGATVRTRSEVDSAVKSARASKAPFLINFLVEKEDSVYPMVAAGSALHEMIRRPDNPMIETAEDA